MLCKLVCILVLKVGIESYVVRCGDGFPNATTVEDGASMIGRTGVSSIVCMGSMGVQETAKAMRTVHSTGAPTVEAAIDRLQTRQSGVRSSIPITFIPTDKIGRASCRERVEIAVVPV